MTDPSDETKRLNAELRAIRKQTKAIKANGKTSYKYTKKKGWQKEENY